MECKEDITRKLLKFNPISKKIDLFEKTEDGDENVKEWSKAWNSDPLFFDSIEECLSTDLAQYLEDDYTIENQSITRVCFEFNLKMYDTFRI